MVVRRAGLVAAAALALAAVAAGCDHDGGKAGGRSRPAGMLTALGRGEGRLDLVALAGYAENGSSDPAIDWVTPFERETGCRVRVRTAATSDEVVALVRAGTFDGASVPGEAARRLVASGDVAPVNTGLISNYADVLEALERLPANRVDGRTYGVPQGWAANLLMWRTDVVRPAPDSWSVVFDPRSPYRGRVTAYDSPLSIAEAALYLEATRPELGIDDVYELDEAQFNAAVGLLKQQRRIIGNDWGDYVQEQAAFASGTAVVGTAWQLVAELLESDRVPVSTVLPREGATGWSDAWMVSSRVRHPTCMYRWLDWMLSPAVNAQVAEWYGEAPSNPKACTHTRDRRHCATFHAADEAYLSKIAFWTTPQRDCGDARGRVCKDWSDWVAAWEEITE